MQEISGKEWKTLSSSWYDFFYSTFYSEVCDSSFLQHDKIGDITEELGSNYAPNKAVRIKPFVFRNYNSLCAVRFEPSLLPIPS